MTPKEKAIYLYTMFKQRTHYIEVLYTPELLDKFHNNAISCALIAVDEISNMEILKRGSKLFNRPRFFDQVEYWQEVKKEIEAL